VRLKAGMCACRHFAYRFFFTFVMQKKFLKKQSNRVQVFRFPALWRSQYLTH